MVDTSADERSQATSHLREAKITVSIRLLLTYPLLIPISQAKLLRAEQSPYMNEGFSSSTTEVFHPNASDSDIPLTVSRQGDNLHQQWDRHGKAVGYAADPSIIHTPKPQVANATFLPLTHPRDVEEAGNWMSKHGRQESTDVVGWHLNPHNDQFPDPYAANSFIQDSSKSTTNPYPPDQHHDVQQTPTQSNFVNGTTTHPHFDDVFGSTTSFRTAPSSPHHEHQETFPPPIYPPPGHQPTSQSGLSQPPTQPRSPPPSSYTTNLRW